ncbi:hypothetical protein ACR6C2_40485 [Streptomyces sp. INA 01156]
MNCFATPEEAAEWNAGKPAGFPVDEKERAAFIAAYKDLARRCEQRDPELLRHVSTTDTARDLDLLRRAVGSRTSPTRGSPTARSWAPPTPTSSPARSAPWSSTATSTRRPGRITRPTTTPGSRRSCAWARTAPRRRPWTGSSPCAGPPPPPTAPSPPAAEGDPDQVRPAGAAAPEAARGRVDLRRHGRRRGEQPLRRPPGWTDLAWPAGPVAGPRRNRPRPAPTGGPGPEPVPGRGTGRRGALRRQPQPA